MCNWISYLDFTLNWMTERGKSEPSRQKTKCKTITGIVFGLLHTMNEWRKKTQNACNQMVERRNGTMKWNNNNSRHNNYLAKRRANNFQLLKTFRCGTLTNGIYKQPQWRRRRQKKTTKIRGLGCDNEITVP